MKKLFELRGTLDKKTTTIIEVSGLIILLFMWFIVTTLKLIPSSILPSPLAVIASFKVLHLEEGLVRNIVYSVFLNLIGYIEAICISLPLGFVIGLIPLARELTKRYVDAMRFIPLTAVTGLFIAWFGLYNDMKIQFLAFGIVVYLLPTVIIRVSEVEEIYIQTVKTLGASKWQIIKSVFIPAVLSKISDDIRVLIAISWTYIIVAELLNSTGGLGSMIYKAGRQSRVDEVFAILLVIILIGFIQDRFLIILDRKVFKHKS